ncbi:MAG: pyridoxine 5'-phosphate synthase, partial [Pseudohongiella sp.]|nr:pyridoxine 5'-phosphate synthase [Pseudohongiella sp.]
PRREDESVTRRGAGRCRGDGGRGRALTVPRTEVGHLCADLRNRAETEWGTGADRVELYTETYARAWNTADKDKVLSQFALAGRAASAINLGVNAGHDLNRDNLAEFLQAVPGVLEVSIGHALIADALELGYSATVAAYLRCIDQV